MYECVYVYVYAGREGVLGHLAGRDADGPIGLDAQRLAIKRGV